MSESTRFDAGHGDICSAHADCRYDAIGWTRLAVMCIRLLARRRVMRRRPTR